MASGGLWWPLDNGNKERENKCVQVPTGYPRRLVWENLHDSFTWPGAMRRVQSADGRAQSADAQGREEGKGEEYGRLLRLLQSCLVMGYKGNAGGGRMLNVLCIHTSPVYVYALVCRRVCMMPGGFPGLQGYRLVMLTLTWQNASVWKDLGRLRWWLLKRGEPPIEPRCSMVLYEVVWCSMV